MKCIDDTGIHPALCLSALARETLDANTRRTKGAYHTDFRLAQYLAQGTSARLRPGVKVVDPACGAGILLTAVSIAACRSDRIVASDWLRRSVYAADLSPTALRRTLLALSALTDDLDSLQSMREKWKIGNSLSAPGRRLAFDGPRWFRRRRREPALGEDQAHAARVRQGKGQRSPLRIELRRGRIGRIRDREVGEGASGCRLDLAISEPSSGRARSLRRLHGARATTDSRRRHGCPHRAGRPDPIEEHRRTTAEAHRIVQGLVHHGDDQQGETLRPSTRASSSWW